jgi:hypothetical protein
MAYGMLVVLGKWQGKQDLLVPTFDVILGLNFLKRAKIALIPYLDGILLANELCPYFVPCHKAVVVESRKEVSNLVLAIAISKALKKCGEVFLAVAVTRESEQVGLAPNIIDGLLKGYRDYRDVMPLELLKKLPPRQVIDHKIELVPGATPPS